MCASETDQGSLNRTTCVQATLQELNKNTSRTHNTPHSARYQQESNKLFASFFESTYTRVRVLFRQLIARLPVLLLTTSVHFAVNGYAFQGRDVGPTSTIVCTVCRCSTSYPNPYAKQGWRTVLYFIRSPYHPRKSLLGTDARLGGHGYDDKREKEFLSAVSQLQKLWNFEISRTTILVF